MIKKAARKFAIDLKRSYVVGDKMDDLLLARNAKLAGGLLVRTGKGRGQAEKLKASPLSQNPVVSDILGAAKWILKT
jgi:D-glycero-D-manno-heptose 1,7-bisphosphate phosphatase